MLAQATSSACAQIAPASLVPASLISSFVNAEGSM
jgi:hypothetical protein